MTGRRAALVVAISGYDDPALRALSAPLADVLALSETLADPAIGDFEVEVLTDEPAHLIREHVERFFSDRRPDDLLLLHFSCHGLKDASGELHLAARNTSPTMLGSTAVDAAFVSRLMRRSRARRAVLTLDCCYGGAFERGLVPRSGGRVDLGDQFDQRDLGGGRGRVVITAASAVEYAFEAADLVPGATPHPSLFTGAFAEGLATGAADRDEDGYVSLEELYDHIHDRVREQTAHQTPSKWEFGLQGELMIARNPHRVIAEATLPDELRDLLTHPVAASRLGVAHELGRLAAGDDLPLAAAARKALRRLAGDDSRRVSSLATELLEQTRLHLDEDSIRFGTLRVGAETPTRSVPIRGVPLTRASRVSASDPGLRAHRVDDVITVEADTSQPREIDATITLDGPAGAAELRVTGEVVGGRPADVGRADRPPTAFAPNGDVPASGREPPTPHGRVPNDAETQTESGSGDVSPPQASDNGPSGLMLVTEPSRFALVTLAGVVAVAIWGVIVEPAWHHELLALRIVAELFVVVGAVAGLWLGQPRLVIAGGGIGAVGMILWMWLLVLDAHPLGQLLRWGVDGNVNLPALAGTLVVLGSGMVLVRRSQGGGQGTTG